MHNWFCREVRNRAEQKGLGPYRTRAVQAGAGQVRAAQDSPWGGRAGQTSCNKGT